MFLHLADVTIAISLWHPRSGHAVDLGQCVTAAWAWRTATLVGALEVSAFNVLIVHDG